MKILLIIKNLNYEKDPSIVLITINQNHTYKIKYSILVESLYKPYKSK